MSYGTRKAIAGSASCGADPERSDDMSQRPFIEWDYRHRPDNMDQMQPLINMQVGEQSVNLVFNFTKQHLVFVVGDGDAYGILKIGSGSAGG